MDRAGRVEDDALRIRVQAFPYDAAIDAEHLLAELAAERLIVRYEVEGFLFLEVHNPPRWTYFYDLEKPSILPACAKHGPSLPEASAKLAPSVEPETESKPARNKKSLSDSELVESLSDSELSYSGLAALDPIEF